MKTTFPARWIRFDGVRPKGIKIRGDVMMSSAPKNWLAHLFVMFFKWREVAILSVHDPLLVGFRIGFRSFDNTQRLRNRLIVPKNHLELIGVRRGYEDCVFFALDPDDRELQIELLALAEKDDPEFKNVPLY